MFFVLISFRAVAPLCRPGQVQVYSIARHETAKIVCELESNPNDVHFNWKFNATGSEQQLDLPASLIAIDRAKSVAHYTPHTEQVRECVLMMDIFFFWPAFVVPPTSMIDDEFVCLS